MENGIKIDVLANEILERIRDQVNSPDTVEEYKTVVFKICKFLSESECDEYDPIIMKRFLYDMESKGCKGVPYCEGYLRFIKRVAFIVSNYAENGIFDFSYKKAKKPQYTINEHHQKLVDDIVKENKLSESVQKDLDHVFRHVFWFFENKGLAAVQITDDDLLEFITEEIPRTVKYTTDRTMRVVRMTASYLKTHNIGDVKKDFSLLKVRGHRENIINPFSTDEVNSILNTMENSDNYDIRDLAIVLLAYDTGLRWCDIKDLKFEDIDWKNGLVSIMQKKTKKPVTLPLSGKTMNAIADYILKERPKSDFREVFLTKKGLPKPLKRGFRILEKASRESGVDIIKRRKFHSLRRTYATEMSGADIPLETISQMLGHKSVKEDKPYLTYNREKISFLTFDFSLVPLNSKFYLDKEDA